MNSSPSETVSRKHCVFIVDDHPLVREGLTNLINRQSDLIVCGEAKDSAEAIDGIAKERPDVAIIDISLTNESGLELIKHLVKQFPQVALIVLSMHDEALYAERALRAGARGYVMKHEMSKNVLASIRRVIGGEVYVSERIVNRMALRLASSGESGCQVTGRTFERPRTGNFSIARPGPHAVGNCRRFESESENRPSLLRPSQRQVRRYLVD